jgi:predicted phosphodiesterase
LKASGFTCKARAFTCKGNESAPFIARVLGFDERVEKVIICAAGDNHGAIEKMYADILEFESALRLRFEAVLHVGDFGIWPDADRIDKATRNHDGAGDFPVWFAENRRVPRRTVFVKGNHEDFVWLDDQLSAEVLPGLFYLKNGQRRVIESEDQAITAGGIGGCFGPSDFQRKSDSLQGYSKRHYTRTEINMLIEGGRLDVLLLHDAPRGVVFETHRRGKGWASDTDGLDDAIRGTRPRICFFGHHHTRVSSSIENVPCIGLNKTPYPGSLVAVDLAPNSRRADILGEWPIH